MYAKLSGEDLPALGAGEQDVFKVQAGGIKRTVVQREGNLLDADEAERYPK